ALLSLHEHPSGHAPYPLGAEVRHGRHRAAQPGQGHLRAGSAKRGDDKPGTVVMHMHGLDKIASAPALAAPAALTRPGPPRPWQLLYPSLPPLPPGWN